MGSKRNVIQSTPVYLYQKTSGSYKKDRGNFPLLPKGRSEKIRFCYDPYFQGQKCTSSRTYVRHTTMSLPFPITFVPPSSRKSLVNCGKTVNIVHYFRRKSERNEESIQIYCRSSRIYKGDVIHLMVPIYE